jgi:3-oxo-4-pregnene-20-carboxyl-CoA dehydrogenase alpha subunit
VGIVDFEVTDTQREIARLAADVLGSADSDGGPAKRAGRAEPADGTDTWKHLAQAGLLALGVPERLGGDGLGVADIATLITEVGRAAAYVPALATVMTGIAPIAAWGDDDLQRELLPAAAAGELILTAAFREPGNPRKPSTMVDYSDGALGGGAAGGGAAGGGAAGGGAVGGGVAGGGSGGRVFGRKVGVLYAGEAGRVLVSVSFAGGGTGVVVVDPAGEGVTLVRTPSATGEPEYTLRLDGAPALSTLAAQSRDLERLAIAGGCALAEGALAGALALTTGYIGQRKQFGRALAQFQAVSQQIADVYIASRTLHLITTSALWRLDAGLDPDDDLHIAAGWVRDTAQQAVLVCHHLHGGIGVDVSYPLHRFSSMIRDAARYVH